MGAALASTLILTLGCQPEPSRNSKKFARGAFGSPQQKPNLASTQMTSVVNPGGDGAMTQIAQIFAAPALSTQPQYALGMVSAQNGVRMWGEAYLIGGGDGGSIDMGRSRLHIEVADNRVGQPDGNGGTLDPFVLHIGYDNTGFENAEGGVYGGQVALRFDQSGYGSVMVTGTVSGNQFSGQVSFTNTMMNGDIQVLGNFNVATCSFFVCM